MFRCITIERPTESLRAILKSFGYVLIKEIPCMDCFYIHQDFLEEYKCNLFNFYSKKNLSIRWRWPITVPLNLVVGLLGVAVNTGAGRFSCHWSQIRQFEDGLLGFIEQYGLPTGQVLVPVCERLRCFCSYRPSLNTNFVSQAIF